VSKDKPKRPSGAEFRKRKQERERAQVADKARDLGLDVREPGATPAPDADTGADAFDVLGDPDLDNPDLALDYVRRAQLIAFGQIIRSRDIAAKDRWRLIREHAAVLGMTHPRAALESRLKRLESNGPKKRGAAAVKHEAPDAVVRPETARGRRGRRGPRPLSEHGPGPAEGEDP
jgi:hypothetical protein